MSPAFLAVSPVEACVAFSDFSCPATKSIAAQQWALGSPVACYHSDKENEQISGIWFYLQKQISPWCDTRVNGSNHVHESFIGMVHLPPWYITFAEYFPVR